MQRASAVVCIGVIGACSSARRFEPVVPHRAHTASVSVAAERVIVRNGPEKVFGAVEGGVVVAANVSAPAPVKVDAISLATGATPCAGEVPAIALDANGARQAATAADVEATTELRAHFARDAIAAAHAFVRPTYLDLRSNIGPCVRVALADGTDTTRQWSNSPSWFIGAAARSFLRFDRAASDSEVGLGIAARGGTWLGSMRVAVELGFARTALPSASGAATFNGFPAVGSLEVPLLNRGSLWLSALGGYEVAPWSPSDTGNSVVLHGPRAGMRVGRVPARLSWPGFAQRGDASIVALEIYFTAAFDGADRFGWTAGAALATDIGWAW